LLPKLRKALRQAADPAKAPIMQAYMKSAMPYHGRADAIAAPSMQGDGRRGAVRDCSALAAQVLDLWRNARFREERYAALYLTG